MVCAFLVLSDFEEAMVVFLHPAGLKYSLPSINSIGLSTYFSMIFAKKESNPKLL